MDFWEALNSEMMKSGFGTNRLVFSTKSSVTATNRPDTSLSVVKDRAVELMPLNAIFHALKEPEIRYIIAKELTSDLLITIYDVNSVSAIAFRAALPLESAELAKIKSWLGKFKRPNFEIRAIGMQSGGNSIASVIEQIHKICKGDIIEIDLFGNSKRHIAFDLKTGMGYDLLLLDRIYRVGELVNDMKDSTVPDASNPKLV